MRKLTVFTATVAALALTTCANRNGQNAMEDEAAGEESVLAQ